MGRSVAVALFCGWAIIFGVEVVSSCLGHVSLIHHINLLSFRHQGEACMMSWDLFWAIENVY
jgi:hypothetical protein